VGQSGARPPHSKELSLATTTPRGLPARGPVRSRFSKNNPFIVSA
jgi:hypothetical protein